MIVISLPDENARIWGIPPYLVQILLTSYHFHVDQTGEAGKKKKNRSHEPLTFYKTIS